MNKINEGSSKGFILEVDLEYPEVLLNLRYVLYLHLYLKLRLKLTKILRALLFEQDRWLNLCIGFDVGKKKKKKNANVKGL